MSCFTFQPCWLTLEPCTVTHIVCCSQAMAKQEAVAKQHHFFAKANPGATPCKPPMLVVFSRAAITPQSSVHHLSCQSGARVRNWEKPSFQCVEPLEWQTCCSGKYQQPSFSCSMKFAPRPSFPTTCSTTCDFRCES